MENYIRAILRLSVIIFSLSLIIFTGCSEENPLEVEEYSLTLANVISNPISPQPGDTTTLSVRVFGYSTGPWPSYFWEVEAGSLLVDNEAVVQWITPGQVGDYIVKARSSLESQSDVCSLVVSIRNYEIIDTGRMYNLYPHLIGDNIFFVSPYDDISFVSNEYISSNVFGYNITTGLVENITDWPLGFKEGASHGADWFVFTGDGQQVVASVFSFYNQFASLQRKNVAKYNLSGVGGEKITDQFNEIQVDRCDQVNCPFPNYDASMVVMQRLEIGSSDDGTKDLLNISFWEESVGYASIITNSYYITPAITPNGDTLGWIDNYFENANPVFTPDDNFIIYFSDSTGIFEPSVIPIVGGQPEISDLMAFDIFSNLGINMTRDVILQWQPDGGNTMAFIATVNNKNTLCFLDYSPGTLNSSTISARTTDITEVSEFVWAPDGIGGAVITEMGVFIVGPNGNIIENALLKQRQTDMVCGVNWASDGSKVGFRIGRMGTAWNEAFSALMVYSLGSDMPVYVTDGYSWSTADEISVRDFDYRWRRVVFGPDNESLYGPITIGEADPGGSGPNPVSPSIKIVHSWK